MEAPTSLPYSYRQELWAEIYTGVMISKANILAYDFHAVLRESKHECKNTLLFKESKIRVFLEAAWYFRIRITAIKMEIKIQNLQIEWSNWK